MNLYKSDDLVEAASLAIDNTLNNLARQQQLEAFGFGTDRFRTGQNLLKEYTQKLAAQTQQQDAQWALSQQINTGLLALQEQFKQHVQVAQMAFRNDSVLLHTLKIDPLSARRWEGVRQALYFYEQLEQQNASLEAYGVSAKEVKQARTAAQSLLQQKASRADKKSCAEQCTEEKREAQKALRTWVQDFRTIARMAFRSQPQTLEAFGIHVSASV
ncbi:MAG: hypothetical protein RIG62_03675 [Cyclobacteriaceae bacterium]